MNPDTRTRSAHFFWFYPVLSSVIRCDSRDACQSARERRGTRSNRVFARFRPASEAWPRGWWILARSQADAANTAGLLPAILKCQRTRATPPGHKTGRTKQLLFHKNARPSRDFFTMWELTVTLPFTGGLAMMKRAFSAAVFLAGGLGRCPRLI